MVAVDTADTASAPPPQPTAAATTVSILDIKSNSAAVSGAAAAASGGGSVIAPTLLCSPAITTTTTTTTSSGGSDTKSTDSSGGGGVKTPFRELFRITLVLDDPAQVHVMSSAAAVTALKTYDLIAVAPTNDKLLHTCCQSLDVDIITFDFARKLSYYLRLATLSTCCLWWLAGWGWGAREWQLTPVQPS